MPNPVTPQRRLSGYLDLLRKLSQEREKILEQLNPSGLPSTGRHLGFIIEDSPHNPAVDRDGNLVDLYGYTSLLLATTQAQQRRILELEQKIGELTKAVDRLRASGTSQPRP